MRQEEEATRWRPNVRPPAKYRVRTTRCVESRPLEYISIYRLNGFTWYLNSCLRVGFSTHQQNLVCIGVGVGDVVVSLDAAKVELRKL